MILSHLHADITGPKLKAIFDATGVPREELMLLVDRKTSHHLVSLTYLIPADTETRVLGVRIKVLEPVGIIGQPKPDGYLELVRDIGPMAEPKFTEAEFDAELKRRTGCTWDDLGGDDEDKERWMHAEDTAQDCVTAYISKYDLDDLNP